jgi:NAD(P)-dependent dehydrogenase (short-subunit alcohol dehydrogenase family)
MNDRRNLQEKVAVVVGGAGGIGRAITLALAEAGAHIATCDIDTQSSRSIASEVAARGKKVLSTVADVSDVEALDRFYDGVESQYQGIDILVNVAGGVTRSAFMNTTRAQHAAAIRLNFGYVLDSVQRAVPLIRRLGRGGSIINFTTIEAHRGAANHAVYAGAKAATTNFSRALAVELAAEGIRVNLIAPDTTPSVTSMRSLDPTMRAKFEALSPVAFDQVYRMYIPQKRPPSEQELADIVLFLASDVSRSITGTTLHVDGGTMAAAGFLDWPFGDGYGPAPLPETIARLFPPNE